MSKNEKNIIKIYRVEKIIWSVIFAYFVLVYIADYHHTQYNKYLIGACMIGVFYAYKHNLFRRENRKILISTTLITGAIMVALIVNKVLDFTFFYYYNVTVTLFVVVYANLYVIMLKKSWCQQVIPKCSLNACMVLLFLFAIQIFGGVDKIGFLCTFIVALPISYSEHTKEQRKCFLYGAVDGILYGFIISQCYAWGLKHYYYNDFLSVRYSGYTEYCTFMGMQYMLFYCASLIKYFIYKTTGAKKRQCIFWWWTSAFILSLTYLTGGRSPVVAMIVCTAIILIVIYAKACSVKVVGKIIVRGMAIGLTSLMLFPVAYASVRYLPTIIGRVDYMDEDSNRRYSFATVVLKQNYYWNGEYSPIAVMTADQWDSPKYITFYEALYESLGRIIPGTTTILDKIGVAHRVYDTQINRVEYCFEHGLISKEELYSYYKEYNAKFESVLDVTKKLQTEEVILYASAKEEQQVIKVDEVKVEPIEQVEDKYAERGSADNPWFEEDYEYSSWELRNALHVFALNNIGLWGHGRMEYEMYATSDLYFGHAHNIFLINGYDFGILSMLLMIMFFITTIGYSYKAYQRTKEVEFLFPLLLVVGMSVYGYWESGFAIQHTIMYIILLNVVLVKENNKGITIE